MKDIPYDIETGRLSKSIILSRTKPFPEFDPAEIKLGNVKDPKKIEAKLKDAKRSHDAARKAHFAKAVEKGALSWKTGRVLVLSFSIHGTVRHLTGDQSADPELFILKTWWTAVRNFRAEGYRFWAWAGRTFDVPFLIHRSWMKGVEVPGFVLDDLRSRKIMRDAMELWTLFEYQTYASLDEAAGLMGFKGKTDNGVTGANFAEMFYNPKTRQKALDYAKRDVELLDDLVGAMRGEQVF